MDLSKLDYNRKPVDQKEVTNSILNDDIGKEVLDGLIIRNSLDLWGLDVDPPKPFTKSILLHESLPQFFIFCDSDGRDYLIDRQGYNYMRYVIRISYGPN